MGEGPHGGYQDGSGYQFSLLRNDFSKVLGILKPFFQEGFKRVQGRALPLHHTIKYPIPSKDSAPSSCPPGVRLLAAVSAAMGAW